MGTVSQRRDAAFDAVLRERVGRPGRCTFAEFMELALYAPGAGYYMNRTAEPGRRGDFFTSVSVGRCFGDLLAGCVAAFWRRFGSPPAWDFVELGAGEGLLLVDVVRALQDAGEEDLCRGLQCSAVDRSHVALERLELRCADLGLPRKVRTGSALDQLEAPAGPAFLVANELVDALPVHSLIRQDGAWRELYVERDPAGELRLVSGELSSGLVAREVSAIPERDYPEGYQTEVRPGARRWLAETARWTKCGVLLILDYGWPAEVFYDPGRTAGTLQCYRGHQKHGDPLLDPGLQDITAHVDFTALERAARETGWQVLRCESQERFLVELAKPRLLAWEAEGDSVESAARAKWLRQFRQLTHPALMGRVFRVLELERESTFRSADAAAMNADFS